MKTRQNPELLLKLKIRLFRDFMTGKYTIIALAKKNNVSKFMANKLISAAMREKGIGIHKTNKP